MVSKIQGIEKSTPLLFKIQDYWSFKLKLNNFTPDISWSKLVLFLLCQGALGGVFASFEQDIKVIDLDKGCQN